MLLPKRMAVGRAATYATLAVLSLLSHSAFALPAAEVLDVIEARNITTIIKRCDNPCGYYGQLCCGSGQSCYTDSNGWPACGASIPASSYVAPYTTAPPSSYGGGQWEYWTSTWVDTITHTTVFSSYVMYSSVCTTTTTQAVASCGWGQQACGPICCADYQYCYVEGQCKPRASGSTSYGASYSQPLRVTSSGMSSVVVASVTPATKTTEFQAAVTTGSSSLTVTTDGSSSLSGGAIAGIVIGVIIALLILFLLCLYLCFRAAWDGLLALFGIGTRRRRTVEVEEYRRTGSRTGGRTWYGDRPNRPPPPKQSSGGVGFGNIAAGLGGLAVLLGLKRRYDRKHHRDEKSSASSGYYSSSYTASSSDRRTRDTRRSSRR